jgi:hypothetical protein
VNERAADSENDVIRMRPNCKNGTNWHAKCSHFKKYRTARCNDCRSDRRLRGRSAVRVTAAKAVRACYSLPFLFILRFLRTLLYRLCMRNSSRPSKPLAKSICRPDSIGLDTCTGTAFGNSRERERRYSDARRTWPYDFKPDAKSPWQRSFGKRVVIRELAERTDEKFAPRRSNPQEPSSRSPPSSSLTPLVDSARESSQ